MTDDLNIPMKEEATIETVALVAYINHREIAVENIKRARRENNRLHLLNLVASFLTGPHIADTIVGYVNNDTNQTAAILTVAGIASIVAGFAKMTKNHKTILEQFKVLDELCETEKNEK